MATYSIYKINPNYLNDDDDDLEDRDNECPICYNEIKDGDKVVLKCKHKYHYECILHAYKTDNSKKKHYKPNYNICPFCRQPGGYLPLKEGEIPIKHIHREYLDYVKGNSENSLIKGVCMAILKSGKNAGKQCKRKLESLDCKYCKIHNK